MGAVLKMRVYFIRDNDEYAVKERTNKREREKCRREDFISEYLLSENES